MNRYRTQAEELFAQFTEWKQGARAERIIGNTQRNLWHRLEAVTEELDTPVEVVGWIPDPDRGGPSSILGQYQRRGKPIQIVASNTGVDRMVYTLTHELGHLFDRTEKRESAMARISGRDEAVAESAAWMVLHERIPLIDQVSYRYLIGRGMSPRFVEVWWPDAAAIADQIEEAITHPERAYEIYLKGEPSR